jgi:ubiquinone/menaquinone biosynthesis C-methylase UbiE
LGWYADRVVPRLVHHAMAAERLLPLRRRTVAGVAGRVLELGIGAGANLPLYGRDVTELVGVDPSPWLLERARRTAAWMPFPVRLLEQSAEHLPLADASVDEVVVTWSLCTIADPLAALRQAHRVLVPGGSLRFVEHGLADAPAVARWQRWLSPAWRRIAGGCRLDRRVDRLLVRAGFTLTALESGYLLPGPRVLTFHRLGVARR